MKYFSFYEMLWISLKRYYILVCVFIFDMVFGKWEYYFIVFLMELFFIKKIFNNFVKRVILRKFNIVNCIYYDRFLY